MYRSLLARFAAVAGLVTACLPQQADFDEFAEQEAMLRCDIAELCTQTTLVCGPPQTHNFDRCDSFIYDFAAECLDYLETQIAELQGADETDKLEICEEVEGTIDPMCSRPFSDASPILGGCSIPGRPLRDVEGRAILPPVIDPDTQQVYAESGGGVARARWLNNAQLEQASVAAFHELARQLESHDAPEVLLNSARAAALDEARHAEACLEAASLFGGGQPQLGCMPEYPTKPVRLRRVAIEALIEGAIGETTAALVAHVARQHARPVLRPLLAQIHDDELRHADLAWATIAWTLAQEPALAGALSQALRVYRMQATPATTPGIPDAGLLSGEEEHSIRTRVIDNIVHPLLAEMVRDSNQEGAEPRS